VARKAVAWIKEDTGIDLGEDEAAFIAMHITASELEGSACSQLQNITDLISSILQIIRLHFKIQFHEDSVSYQRFITHLKFFSARIFDRTPYQDTMQEIYQVLVSQNEHAYSGVKKVADLIKRQYDYTLSMDEQLYLLIHLKRILDEEQET
jgi:beta-glucoside operon transcriptional antiterminator